MSIIDLTMDEASFIDLTIEEVLVNEEAMVVDYYCPSPRYVSMDDVDVISNENIPMYNPGNDELVNFGKNDLSLALRKESRQPKPINRLSSY